MKKSIYGFAVCLGFTALLAGCSQPSAPVASATPAAASATASPVATATPAASATPAAESPTPAVEDSATPGASSETTQGKVDEAGIEFSIPAGWRSDDKDGTIAVGPADDSCVILFMIPPDQNADKVGEVSEQLLNGLMTDVKAEGEGEQTERNGLKIFTLSGTGKSDGKDMDWNVEVINGKKLLMVTAMGEKAGIEANAKEIGELYQSIKASE